MFGFNKNNQNNQNEVFENVLLVERMFETACLENIAEFTSNPKKAAELNRLGITAYDQLENAIMSTICEDYQGFTQNQNTRQTVSKIGSFGIRQALISNMIFLYSMKNRFNGDNRFGSCDEACYTVGSLAASGQFGQIDKIIFEGITNFFREKELQEKINSAKNSVNDARGNILSVNSEQEAIEKTLSSIRVLKGIFRAYTAYNLQMKMTSVNNPTVLSSEEIKQPLNGVCNYYHSLIDYENFRDVRIK